MDTLRVVLTVIFVIDSILLVIAVLLQSGRGGGLAGALGGISSADSALGVRAASQIEKATGVMAAVFLLVALVLALMSSTTVPLEGETPIGERGVSAVADTSPAAEADQAPGDTTGAAETEQDPPPKKGDPPDPGDTPKKTGEPASPPANTN